MAKEKYLKLNLGCGWRHFEGWLNVDRQELCDPDMQVDLEECPWPWDDNSVSDVRLINSLEHMGQDLQTFTSIMKELYRVAVTALMSTSFLPIRATTTSSMTPAPAVP